MKQLPVTNNHKWLIFLALALSVVMVDVDMTAVNLAIATIAKELQLTLPTAQWIINGYTIAATALIAFGGRCGDVFGRKKIFQRALLMFAVASVAVGVSQGDLSIVISRILQGACIAFTFPLATIIARDIFPANQRGFAIGLLISIAGISQSIGPTVGGLIIHFANWRWIFFINVPLALCSYWLIHHYLPTSDVSNSSKMDFLGLLSLIIGLFAVITALNGASATGIASFDFISLMVLGIIGLSVFAFREFHTPTPLLDLSLLLNKPFTIIITTRMFVNFIYFSWLFLLGLLLQNILDHSTIESGFIMLFLTAIIAVLATPVGKLIDAIGSKTPLLIGLSLMTISCLLLSIVPQYQSIKYLAANLLLSGIAIGLLIPSSATAAMHSAPMKKGGAAMGVLFTCGFLGAALGVAISGWLLTLISNASLQAALIAHKISIESTLLPKLMQMASGTLNLDLLNGGMPHKLIEQVIPLVDQAFYAGFSMLMYIMASLAFIAFILNWSLSKKV